MKPSEIINKLALGIAKCQLDETKKQLKALGKNLINKLGSEEEQLRTLLPANTATAIAIYLDILYNKGAIKHDGILESMKTITIDQIAALIRAGVTATDLMDDVTKSKEDKKDDTEK